MIITGAVYISQLLNVTHTLQVLYMSYNNISDDGMTAINKSLTTLMVPECGLSLKGTVVCKIECGIVTDSVNDKSSAREKFCGFASSVLKVLPLLKAFLGKIFAIH